MFMDLYTIKRIIDKDYTKNIILYTGMAHTVNIINILIKYFFFEITHTFYNEISIDKLNLKFKNNEYNIIKNNYIHNNLYNYLLPEYLSQCTNMINFPDIFYNLFLHI